MERLVLAEICLRLRMSEVIESAKLLCLLLGRLEDVSQNLRSDRSTSLTDKRLMPTRFQNPKQRTRFCKDVFCSIEKNFLVEHGLSGGKAVMHFENSEACNASNFAHQRGGRIARRYRNGHTAHLRRELIGNDRSWPTVASRLVGAKGPLQTSLVPQSGLGLAARD